MVEYLELFKGDDTDFSLNQAICIKLVTDYDLAGCTAHVKFYDYEQTFYPIVDKKLPLSFPSSATSKFPLGRGTAKIWLTEPDPEGAGTRRRTVANDLKILVTNNIDILSRKDISYTMLLRYDYNDLDSKPMLNGKVIEGDHTDDYYGIKSANPDTKLSEESENAVQNKVIAVKFKETDEAVERIDADIENAAAAASAALTKAENAQTAANAAQSAANAANEALVGKLDKTAVVAPSASATAGQAADAKAVNDALAGKVNSQNGVVKNSLAVSEAGFKTTFKRDSIICEVFDGVGVSLVIMQLPQKDGTFALTSDIEDAVKDKANQNDLDALAAKVDNANATLEEIA